MRKVPGPKTSPSGAEGPCASPPPATMRATLHFPATDGKPAELEWAGAHTAVTSFARRPILPRHLAMQGGTPCTAGSFPTEQAHAHVGLPGQGGRASSCGAPKVEKWLASSGAPAAIVWAISRPRTDRWARRRWNWAPRGDTMVTTVACHPLRRHRRHRLCRRHGDGGARFAPTRREVLLRRSGKGAVTALAWVSAGQRLAVGTETGDFAGSSTFRLEPAT